MDGAKALSEAVNEVFGGLAAVQGCTLHRRRNVEDHLPDKEKAWVDAKLVKAANHPNPDLGLRNAKHLASLLDKAHPGAGKPRWLLSTTPPGCCMSAGGRPRVCWISWQCAAAPADAPNARVSPVH